MRCLGSFGGADDRVVFCETLLNRPGKQPGKRRASAVTRDSACIHFDYSELLRHQVSCDFVRGQLMKWLPLRQQETFSFYTCGGLLVLFDILIDEEFNGLLKCGCNTRLLGSNLSADVFSQLGLC